MTANRRHGFTLLEMAITVALLGIFLTGIMTTVLATQNAFVENQSLSRLQLRAQRAMNRLVAVTRQAITDDPAYSPFAPDTGIKSKGLRFRLISALDADGKPIYDDTLRVFILGPTDTPNPCKGLIIGRGSTLGDVFTAGKGPDGVLGTLDDDTTTTLAGNTPAVELLVPNTFAPSTGEMFTIDVDPAPLGRLLTLTLRLNVRDRDGNFIFPNDVVLQERIALLQ